MSVNFAPYQDIPETQRALSPPLVSPRASVDRTRNISSITSPTTRTYEQHDYFGAGDDSPDTERVAWNTPAASQPLGFGAAREDVDMFTTSLGLRMDYEACLAYLLLPPAFLACRPESEGCALTTAYGRTVYGLALRRNSKVITFLQWRGIRVKHTGKQQKHGPSLTATRTAKKWSLEQAQVLSALEHSQAFLISLGAQRQAGWRRDKHWVGRAWQVLHVLVCALSAFQEQP